MSLFSDFAPGGGFSGTSASTGRGKPSLGYTPPSVRAAARVGGVTSRAPATGAGYRTGALASAAAPEPWVPPQFPVRIGGTLPFSTYNPTQTQTLTAPAFKPDRNIFESVGDMMGDLTSGKDLNLMDYLPRMLELPWVSLAELGGVVGTVADGILAGGRPTPLGDLGRGVKSTVYSGLDVVGNVAEAVSTPIAEAMQVLPNAVLTRAASERADAVRRLGDRSLTLEQALGVRIPTLNILGVPPELLGYQGANGLSIDTLRKQGLTDDAIRAVFYDAIDLPASVKEGILANPKGDVREMIENQGPLAYSYGTDFTSQAQNLLFQGSYLIGEIALVSVATGAIGGRVAAAAAGTRAAMPVQAAGWAVGKAAAGIKLNAKAGVVVYLGDKMLQAIAQSAGIRQAYDFGATILSARPISEHPNAAFVSSIFFGMPGLKGVAKAVTYPIRKGTSIAANAALSAKLGSIKDLESKLIDVLAKMHSDDDVLGHGYVKLAYGLPDGTYNMPAMLDDVLGSGLDIATKRLGPKSQAWIAYAGLIDPFARTIRMWTDQSSAVWKIILEEPQAMADFWRGPAWSRHMSAPGVAFDAEAMIALTAKYRAFKDATADFRSRLPGKAVVGMHDQVPLDYIYADRMNLLERFPSADDVLPNSYVADLLVNRSGYRHAMEEVAGPGSGPVKNGSWTRGEMEAAMDMAADRFAQANKMNARMALIDTLPENAPIREIAKALQTDERTVFNILHDHAGAPSVSAIDDMQKFVVLKGLRTLEAAQKMKPAALQKLAQKHMDGVTQTLIERGKVAVTLSKQMEGHQKEYAEYVAAGDVERAAEIQRRMDAISEMGIALHEPLVPATSRIAAAHTEQRLADEMQARADSVVRIAQAQIDGQTLDDLLGEAERLIPNGIRVGAEDGLQAASRLVFNGRFIGTAPRWSETVLAKMAKAIGRKDGFDNPIDAANWIRANWRHLDGKQKGRLRAAAGGWGRGTKEIDRVLAHGFDEPSEWAEMAGRGADADDWVARVEQVVADYDYLLAPWRGSGGGAEATIRRLEMAPLPPVSPRAQYSFLKSLSSRSRSAGDDPALAMVEFKNASTARKVQMMNDWGFHPERAVWDTELGVGGNWVFDDPKFRRIEHPKNVTELEKRIARREFPDEPDPALSLDEASSIEDALRDGWEVSGRDGLFDTDRILTQIAMDELRQADRLRYLVDTKLGYVDWHQIDAAMAKRIADRARADIKATAKPGEIDDAILAGGTRDSEISLAMRAPRVGDPKRPVRATPEQAERYLGLPPAAPPSYKLAKTLTELGQSLRMRVNQKVMADPALQRGMQTLGAILHNSSAARPQTLEGVLIALREIENGNARLSGIGPELLADAVVAGEALAHRAIMDAKNAGFLPGTWGTGMAPWMLGTDDLIKAKELFGEEVMLGNVSQGLTYGIKKAGKNSIPYENISTVDRIAAQNGTPGLYEELISGRFLRFDERVNNVAANRALELMTGTSKGVASAYSKDPIGYLFGKMTNRSISEFVHDQFVARCLVAGVTKAEADAVWLRLGEVARDTGAGATKGGGKIRKGVSEKVALVSEGDRKIYMTIGNIKNEVIERQARSAVRDHYAKSGGSHPGWANDNVEGTFYEGSGVAFQRILHEAASPVLRHLEDGLVIGGKVVRIPFNDAIAAFYHKAAFNQFRTWIYPLFRFSSDLRFLAMELVEPYALGAGRTGLLPVRYVNEKGVARGLAGFDEVARVAGTGENVVAMGSGGTIGSGTRRITSAMGSFVKERAPKLDAEIARMMKQADADGVTLTERAAREIALERSPALRAEVEAARAKGFDPTPAEFESMLKAAAKTDPELMDAIETFSAGKVERWLDEVDAEHLRIVRAVDPEVGVDAEVAAIIARNPALAEIATRVGEVNKSVWADVRETFWGRVDRSRAERILNHPLLWWPLSYQIKALTWLSRILFHRIGGVETRGLGAYELDQMVAAHNRAMAEDPEYSQFLERHRTLLFAASMFLPLTPDAISVSASPILQALVFDRNKALFEIGPVYTITKLLPKAYGELWGDVGSSQTLHDTPVVGELAQRVFSTGSPNERVWDETGWAPPESVAYNP